MDIFRFGETSNFGMTSFISKWIWWFIMIHLNFFGYIHPSCIYQRWVYDVCSNWQHDGRLQEADPNETIYRCDWKHFVFTSTRTIVAPSHDTRNPHQRKLLNWCPTLEARSANVLAFDNTNHGMICLQGNRCWPERRQWKTPNTQKSFHLCVESNALIVEDQIQQYQPRRIDFWLSDCPILAVIAVSNFNFEHKSHW